MTTVVGSGALSFEVAEGWGTLPDGMTLKETPDVAVDSKDNVYAFSRGDHGVVVFDRDGNYLKAWGAEVFGNAHGICIGPDDAVYCVDNGDHTVRKFSTDGELLMTLGTKDKPSPRFSGEAFNLPTGLAGNGMPLGVQLASGPFQEERLLTAAAWCERVLDVRLTPIDPR